MTRICALGYRFGQGSSITPDLWHKAHLYSTLLFPHNFSQMAYKRTRYGRPSRGVFRARSASRSRLRTRRPRRRVTRRKTLSRKAGFPNILFMRHSYHNTLSKTITASGPANVQVNITNLANPLEDVSDLREVTFKDEIEGIYKNYVVLGAKVVYDVVLQENTGTPVYAVSTLDNDPVLQPYMNTLMTAPGTRFKLLTGDTSDSRSRSRLVQNYSMKKRWGRNPPMARLEATSDSFVGPSAINSTYARLYLWQPTTVASPGTPVVAFISIHVSYYVKWYNRGDVVPSFFSQGSGLQSKPKEVTTDDQDL